ERQEDLKSLNRELGQMKIISPNHLPDQEDSDSVAEARRRRIIVSSVGVTVVLCAVLLYWKYLPRNFQ
ncbi:hypothetical protein NPIL_209721, partial [Nephila pilipes]